MRGRKRVMLLISLMPVLALTVAVAALRVQNPEQSSQPNGNSRRTIRQGIDETQFPIADPDSPLPTDPLLRSRRQARGRRYNRPMGAISPHHVEITDDYHWPQDFPALPVAQSDVIIIGQVTDARAYLSEDKSTVYSEFTIRVIEPLKNTAHEPVMDGGSLSVDRAGGRVRFPGGNTVRYAIDGFGMPRVGHQYVLFLKREEQAYRILTGYELLSDEVRPLDSSGVVNFRRYENYDANSFLNELRTAITNN